MSHWTTVELQIKSIDALKQACRELGLEFTDELTAVGYAGIKTEVDHNIRVRGTHYTVGVKKEGNTYSLTADFFDRTIRKAIGEDGNQLKQTYATCLAEREARKKGYSVSRQKLENGKMKLTVRVK